MKTLILLLSLLTLSTAAYCNKETEPFEKKYKHLIEYATNEEWGNSEKLCKELLSYTEKTDSLETEKEVLRYIYIYATAGLLNENKLSKEQALKNIKFLQSKVMIMPTHPFNSNCYVNCTQIADEEVNTFFTGVNNKAGTVIFSFEYVQIKDGIQESKDELEGKYITLKGELNEISVEGNMFPRFKLKFINGNYIVSDN